MENPSYPSTPPPEIMIYYREESYELSFFAEP